MKDILLKRFLKYVGKDTQSDEFSDAVPSTFKQMEFARMLEEELRYIGLSEIFLDERGYLMATLPSNIKKQAPVIGFIAHMDTSPDMTGANVNPRIFKNYDGKNLILNEKKHIILSPDTFPELLNYKGQTLITTDGTTLLGADDKAGIAEIITAMEYLISNPDIPHGEIRIGFTPDEEIGRGADHFDIHKFRADFAYTLDGGQTGELEFENFNAALAVIRIKGRNVHPGTAKDKMINSQHLAMDYHLQLPHKERPEHTEGYEGFFHLIDSKGSVEKTELRYLVRDHSHSSFEFRKKFLRDVAAKINRSYDESLIQVEIKDQYYNMKSKIEPVYHIVELAEEAMKNQGIPPIIKPIRGGTDGARLSHMGLPCPNLFTGGHNYHGKYEFIPLESMEKAVKVILEIIRLVVK
ncbi:MAG: peptidase T [Bacteroidota bacterium]